MAKASPASKAGKKKKQTKATGREAAKGDKARSEGDDGSTSLVNQMIGLTSQLTTGALEMIAKSGRFIPLMPGDKSFRGAYLKTLDPTRMEAMADAGHFLQDARQVAGLNVAELSEAVGLTDSKLLEDVEKGVTTLPFDTILRVASLTARHDPLPFILKFLRTYNPDLERGLQQWGVSQWPQHFERERRFINIFRQHDVLRDLSDNEYERFIGYLDAATDLMLDIMLSENSGHEKASRPPADD